MRLIATTLILVLNIAVLFAQGALTAEITNATIKNDCQDGSIDLSINGGFSPYDVIWDYVPEDPDETPVLDYHIANGVEGNDDGEDIDQTIGPGTYTVFVTDALCGTATSSFTVECGCLECELMADVTSENCQSANGSITIVLSCTEESEGSAYTYQWSDLDSNDPQTGIRNNLSSGEYCLTISDGEACTYTGCWSVESEVGEFPIPELIEQSNITFCIEGGQNCTGSLTIEVPSGAEITWLNIPNQSQVSSETVTGLCEGTYSVEVIENGCGFVWQYDVDCCIDVQGEDDEIPLEPLRIELVNKVSPSTATSFNGLINLNIIGGSEEYVITWTGPNGFTSSDESLSGLGPGEHCITVNDGCNEEDLCITLVDCSMHDIVITDNVINTCPNVSFGEISLSLIGGVEPISLSWSNGSSSLSISDLSQGQYCVTITDDSGCEGFQVVECFTVGLSAHQFSHYTTNPCGTQFTCNGRESIFEPYDGSLDCKYENCTEWTCRCPLTNGVVSTRDDGNTSFRYSPNNCTIEGRCRDFPSVWEVVYTGNEVFGDPIRVPLPNCNCVDCLKEVFCQFFINGNRRVARTGRFESADLSECGLDGVNPDCVVLLKDYEYMLRSDNILGEEEFTLILPQDLNGDTHMDFYNRYIDSLMVNNRTVVIRNFEDDEKINELECDEDGDAFSHGVNNRSSNPSNKNSVNSKNVQVICMPNPFSKELIVNIENSNINDSYSYQIYNVLGQVVQSGVFVAGKNLINSEEFELGTYFIVLYDEKERFYFDKIIKN